ADAVVELDGRVVTPAFVDAHVHTTDTGLILGGLDLSGVRSAMDVLDTVAAFSARLESHAIVLGHGWDESTWADQRLPTAAELDQAGGGRPVYLAQASVHSALCSTALISAGSPDVLSAPGFDESGWLRRDAHHVVRAIALGSLSPVQRRDAQRA